MMNPTIAFDMQIGIGTIICAIAAKKYVWPKLAAMPVVAALIPLMLVAATRYLGGTLLVANLNGNLPAKFVTNGGYGDLVASVIALVAAFALMYSGSFGKFMVWVYAIVGGLDFLYAVFLALTLNVFSQVGLSWIVMVTAGAIQLVNLIVIWALLLRKPNAGMVA